MTMIGRLWIICRDPWRFSFRWNGPYDPKAYFSRRNFVCNVHIGPLSISLRRKEVDKLFRDVNPI